MDLESFILGGAITSLLGESSAPGVVPSEEWAIAEILGSAYGYTLGFTSAPAAEPSPSGDISFFVHDGFSWLDRTDWLIYPLKRSAQVGSRGQLSITITNAGKADGSIWRPSQFNDVRLWIGTYLWFSGQYMTGTETRLGGTSYFMIKGTCLTYDARMDKIMMRQQILFNQVGATAVGDWIHENIVLPMGTLLGIALDCNIVPFASEPLFTCDQTFDTISLLQSCSQAVADQFNCQMYLDQNLKLWFFNTDNSGAYGLPFGIGAAPFDILDLTPDAAGEPLWQNLAVTNGGSQYCNRAYVKNNQSVKGNTGDDNPFNLSYVPSVADAGEISRVGPVECVQSVKNQSLGQLPNLAESGLVAFEIHAADIETFQIGFEPGQRLTVNTSIPLLDDILIISSVDSDLVGPFTIDPFLAGSGPIRFQHKIKADNAKVHARSSGMVVWNGVVQGIAPPVDRTTYTPSWEIAITIPGSANPGVQVTDTFADIPALKSGICRQCTVGPFKVAPVTTDLIFDVLLNGTSIFPASPGGITYPVGGTEAVVTFTFRSDPEPVSGPSSSGSGTSSVVDKFSLVVLQGDADAQDGVIAITVQG